MAEHTTAILQTCVCPFVSTAYILALLFLQAPVKGYKRLHTSVVHVYTVLPKLNVYVSHIPKCLFQHCMAASNALHASITLTSSIPFAILTSNRSTFRSFPCFQGQVNIMWRWSQTCLGLVADLSATRLCRRPGSATRVSDKVWSGRVAVVGFSLYRYQKHHTGLRRIQWTRLLGYVTWTIAIFTKTNCSQQQYVTTNIRFTIWHWNKPVYMQINLYERIYTQLKGRQQQQQGSNVNICLKRDSSTVINK